MDGLVGKLLLEIALLAALGMLYYFYQKKKILDYERNKGPLIMGYLLQSCITERGETPHPQLDSLIEALDDYLQNKTHSPPTSLLIHFANSAECSAELQDIITEGIRELNAP